MPQVVESHIGIARAGHAELERLVYAHARPPCDVLVVDLIDHLLNDSGYAEPPAAVRCLCLALFDVLALDGHDHTVYRQHAVLEVRLLQTSDLRSTKALPHSEQNEQLHVRTFENAYDLLGGRQLAENASASSAA